MKNNSEITQIKFNTNSLKFYVDIHANGQYVTLDIDAENARHLIKMLKFQPSMSTFDDGIIYYS